MNNKPKRRERKNLPETIRARASSLGWMCAWHDVSIDDLTPFLKSEKEKAIGRGFFPDACPDERTIDTTA